MPSVRVVLTNIQTDAVVADLSPISWKVGRRINNTGSWNFVCPMILPRAAQLENFCSVRMYLDGVEMMHGTVDKVKRTMTGDKVGYNVSGLGEVEALARSMAKDTSHYQNVNVLLILNDLLTYAGWGLGNTTTVLDTSVRTTIDLRNEENMLAQIQQVCQSTPGLFWRYGGLSAAGVPTLDVGFFDAQSSIRVAQAGTLSRPGFGLLKKIDFVENHSDLIYQIAGYGGNYEDGSGDQALITLDDALAAGVAQDPGFPIVVAANGQTVVENSALAPIGGTVRMKFDIHVTENGDTPTNIEVDQAAIALYWRCVRFLQEHANSDEEYQLSCTHIRQMPEVGDRIWVNAHTISGLDEFSGQRSMIPGFSFDGSLRAGEWQISGSGDNIDVSMKLTENEHIGFADDADIQMYDTLKSRIPNTTQFGSLMNGVRTSQITTDTTVPAGSAANCFAVSGDPLTPAGLVVDCGLPTVGGWVNTVSLIHIDTPGYNWRIVQNPVLPATTLILCIWPDDNSDWTVSDSLTVSVTWLRSE